LENDIDVAYQYLTFFHDDDEEIAKVAEEYRSGRLLSGELKAMTIKILTNFVKEFQERKAKITPELVKAFMDPNRTIDPTVNRPVT